MIESFFYPTLRVDGKRGDGRRAEREEKVSIPTLLTVVYSTVFSGLLCSFHTYTPCLHTTPYQPPASPA